MERFKNIDIYNLIGNLISKKNFFKRGLKKSEKNFYADMSKTNNNFKWKPKINIIKGINFIINE